MSPEDDTARAAAHPPRVSIVVPAYDAEDYLEECLTSAREQTFEDFEVLVVDDGSHDRTAEILAHHARQDPRLRPLAHPGRGNRGVSYSRALAIEQARGELIAFLDADDAFLPHKLERQVEELDRFPDCVLCHTGVEIEREDDARSGGAAAWVEGLYDFFTERHYRMKRRSVGRYALYERPDALTRNYICNSSVVVRRRALSGLRIGFPQLFQVEDWTLWMRLALVGPFLLVPEPLTRYRRHARQATLTTERHRLKNTYARLEGLLFLLAEIDDGTVRHKLEEILPEALHDVMGSYLEEGEPAWHPGGIDLPRRDAEQYRRRRYRRRLAHWWRTLFGR